MTIQEIEQAITELSQKELARFREWFDELDAQARDEQFEHDARSGELDKLASREHIHSLRGRYKGKGLMKALMTQKRRERDARA